MPLITSIKHKALVTFVSFTLCLAAVFMSLAVVSAFVVEDGFVARLLNLEVKHSKTYYQEYGRLPEPRFDFVTTYTSLEQVPEFARQAFNSFSIDQEIFTDDEKHFHYATIELNDGKQAYLLAEVSELLIVTSHPLIFSTFLWALLFALAVAIWLAVKMSALTVKPVMALTQAVENKTPMPKLKHELGYLADTLQQAFDDLDSTLAREKEFTTDVSHELRTPLTVLQNITTLAEQRALTDADLEQLRCVSQQMQHTIDVLLTLARSESLEKQPCPLKPLLEQAAMQSIIASGKSLELEITMADDFKVNANQTLLNLLLTNLINNAISHASSDQLTVTLSESESALLFHNQTNGHSNEQIFKPGVKSDNSQGIGQGLYLVTRILESLGWQHQLQQTESSFAIKIQF